MGLIDSFKSAFSRGRSGDSKPDAPRAQRSGSRIRNPPGVEDQRRGPPQGQDQYPNDPPRSGLNEQFDQNPGTPADRGNQFDDPGRQNPGSPGTEGGVNQRPDSQDDLGPAPGRDQNLPRNPGSDRNMDRRNNDFETGAGSRGSQQAMSPRQERGRELNTDEPAPRHYNFDLPMDDDEGEIIESELQQIADQNEQIIELLQQIRNDLYR